MTAPATQIVVDLDPGSIVVEFDGGSIVLVGDPSSVAVFNPDAQPPPGPAGKDGKDGDSALVDVGDLTLLFDNKLI